MRSRWKLGKNVREAIEETYGTEGVIARRDQLKKDEMLACSEHDWRIGQDWLRYTTIGNDKPGQNYEQRQLICANCGWDKWEERWINIALDLPKADQS